LATLIFVGVLFCGMGSAKAAEEAAVAEKPRDAVAALAALIDRHLNDRLDEENIAAAPIAGDAEFLRRAYLDLVGRIPSVAEARAFLQDTSPDKRRRLVERLLEDSGYVTHFATYWRNVLMPEEATDFGARFQVPGFEAWLRQKLTANTPYDKLVYELLTAPIDGQQVSPTAFYSSKEIKPENLAAGTSRMFLGVRLECAQCHNHPFDRWEQKEFWSFAAFFAGMERDNRGGGASSRIREFFSRRTLMIPDTDIVAYPVYLNGDKPRMALGDSSRDSLAKWVTAKDNPYFARMAVNRLWDHFFGRGFVSPVDDFSDNNPPSHPELLDELAREMVANNFNIKLFIQAITASDAYQRASTGGSPSEPYHFARMSVKGLAAEQIFASLAQAIGHQVEFNPRESYDFSFQARSPKSQFLERFADDSPNHQERQTSVLQALALMNGDLIANATKLEGSNTLAAVAQFPGLSAEEQVETLFLAALTRKPTPQELSRFANYVQSGGPRNDSKEALADVFWVLLNTSEFLFNH
jgi:hypothetical protein